VKSAIRGPSSAGPRVNAERAADGELVMEVNPDSHTKTTGCAGPAGWVSPAGGPAGGRQLSGTGAAARLRPRHLQVRLAAMTSGTDSNPEDEYADDEYADHDAEDREQPPTPADIPDDEPEEDVLEQRQEDPYREDER